MTKTLVEEAREHLQQRYLSWWGRVFSWRYHVDAVERIVNDKEISSLHQLVLRLEAIPLVNPTGMLATIIHEIKNIGGSFGAEITPQWSQKSIGVFLNEFHYLNHHGKRQGFLFWANENLTRDLELIARKMVRELNLILTGGRVPDEQKFDLFIQVIEDARIDAWEKRRDHAPEEAVPNLVSRDLYPVTVYKTPYAAGKFEESLVHALTQVKQTLNGFPNQRKAVIKLEQLIQSIESYVPLTEKVETANCSRG